MNRRSRLPGFRLLSGAGALIAGVAFFAVPAQAGYANTSCSDCYVITPVTVPATAAAGTGEDYAFQVTNNDPDETLKNLSFTAPADFVITGATGPSGTSVSAVPGSSVTLNLPAEPAGSTFTVHVTALAPCAAASPGAWGVSGIDSRGETNEVQWSSTPLSVPVTGQCGLAFTGQPAQTAVNSNILTGFNSTGGPLTVQLADANKNPLNPADFSASGTQVTVSIATNPGGGTLAGTATVTSSNGVAHFEDLQINAVGVGYALAANAPGFASATSNLFTITGQIQACGSGPCSASQSTATTATSATTTARGDFVALGLGGATFTCPHYTAVSDPADFGVFDSAGDGVAGSSATATLTLSKSAVQSSPRPLILWQVCYVSPEPFPAIPGTRGTTVIGGTTYHTGLLLPCLLLPGHKQPCLISQRYTATGGVKLTFFALGDPYWRG
jgi:hypothetical protein